MSESRGEIRSEVRSGLSKEVQISREAMCSARVWDLVLTSPQLLPLLAFSGTRSPEDISPDKPIKICIASWRLARSVGLTLFELRKALVDIASPKRSI